MSPSRPIRLLNGAVKSRFGPFGAEEGYGSASVPQTGTISIKCSIPTRSAALRVYRPSAIRERRLLMHQCCNRLDFHELVVVPQHGHTC